MIGEATGGPEPVFRWKLYDYENPVVDVRGRGFLGFETVRELDLQRRSETITRFYLQEEEGVYPTASVPKQVTHIVPILPLPTDPADDLPDIPAGDLTARVVETTYTHDVAWSWTHVYAVRPEQIRTRTWEQDVTIDEGRPVLHGNPHDERLEVQTFSYDAFGNTTYASSIVYGLPLYSITIAEYENREQEWLLGLPKWQTFEQFDNDDLPPEPRRVEYQHDDRGLLQRTIVEPTHPELTLTTELFRNDDGLVAAVRRTAAAGVRSTYFAHDPAERMFVRAAWNDLGHTKQAVHHPALGVPVVARDENGVETRYQYDRFGRVRQIDPDGGTAVSLSYASTECSLSAAQRGMCVETAGEDGRLQVSYFDEFGRPWETAVRGFDGALSRMRVAYNAFGQRTLAGRPFTGAFPPVAPVGLATVTQYDSLGRVLSVVLPDGATSTFTHSMFQSTATDPVGRKSIVKHDAAGRIIESAQIKDAGPPARTFYSHGPFNQIDVILPPDAQAVLMEYDKLGRRTVLADPDAGTRSFTYNAFGELERVEDALHSVSFTRDVLGRVTLRNETHDDNGALVTETAGFVYDQGTGAVGRLSSASASAPDSTSVDFQYDALGRPVKAEWTVAGDTFAMEATYDSFGRPDLLRYPAMPGDHPEKRFTLRHSYKADTGHFAAIGRYYPNGPPLPAIWKVEQREVDGQLASAAWDCGMTETRTHDPETGRLQLLLTHGNADLFGLHYDYFPDGNIEARRDVISGREESFTYDALNRLHTYSLELPEDPQGHVQWTYEYDDINRLRRVLQGGTEIETFAHDDAAKPRALSAMIDAQGQTHTFQYDARGRQKARDQQQIHWSSFDLPRLIEGPSGFAAFSYDPFGTRVRKVTGDEETITLAGLYERRTTADTVTHVFYVHGTEGPVAQLVRRTTPVVETTEMQYLQRDQHGSVGLVFDSQGEEIKGGRLYFDPFGQRTDASGKPTAPTFPDVALGFTGHRHDDELGLINMGGRVYDPAQRRFLTPDPVVADPTFGPAYNRFAYALNNPLAYTDPTGFKAAPTHPEGSPPPFQCVPPECRASGGTTPSLMTDLPKGTKPASVGSSTGEGVKPPTGGTSEWGPSMSDAPAADADKAASDEHERGLLDKLSRAFAAAETARRGMHERAIEIVVGTAVSLGATGAYTALGPMQAEAIGLENPAIGLVAGILDAPELTGNRTADILLHQVPIVRIGQGFAEGGQRWMAGDYEGAGRAWADPQGELAMVFLGAMLGGGPKGPAQPSGAGGQVLRHYTNEAGFKAIQEANMLLPNAKGQVFATQKALNPLQAFNELFIGAPTHAGRGQYVIEFTLRQGVKFVPGKPGELIHRGALRFGRHADVLFAGPNPYP